ncbi:hypothetical protein LPJ78_004290 [Coemansia sp. RSA 989]|nr:hypothetical protein LPJ78_004290 [Coemansia sp. RSA 989]KAJ1870840.1 hypothetical protein LPJ55_004356 [Coemansia sp. RSA 990]
MSSKEQARRERNRVRISLRRQKETEEERRRRLESERIRAAQRRLNESEAEREQRRYKSRVRGVERRRNETEEERARRRAMNRARMAEVRRNKKKAYESELFGESPEPPENDREHARNGAQKYVAIRPRTDSLPHERQQTATRSYESALSEAVTSGMSTSVNYTQQSAWPSHAISQVPASLSTAALGHGVVQQPLPIPLTAYPGVPSH